MSQGPGSPWHPGPIPPERVRTQACSPDGHFYSPIVDTLDVASRSAQIWPEHAETPGIDWNEASHRRILGEYFPRHLPKYDYPEDQRDPAAPREFYSSNPAFGWLDSRALFVLLNEWRPRRMIEVGCGYSTLLAADIGTRFLGGQLDLVGIEPYPPAFLTSGNGLRGLRSLVVDRVERVGFEPFEALERGDVVFIDSSHVSMTGSDVNFLLFEVLPRLRAGVRIHIHDIHLPNEYLPQWVVLENRSWNEQYVVRALLMYSTAFRVLFGSAYAYEHMPEAVATALGDPLGPAMPGGSLWIERT